MVNTHVLRSVERLKSLMELKGDTWREKRKGEGDNFKYAITHTLDTPRFSREIIPPAPSLHLVVCLGFWSANVGTSVLRNRDSFSLIFIDTAYYVFLCLVTGHIAQCVVIILIYVRVLLRSYYARDEFEVITIKGIHHPEASRNR